MLIRYDKLLSATVMAVVATTAWPQTTPDAGSLLREAERSRPQLPRIAPQGIPQAPAALPKDDVRVTVKAFKLTGNTLIPTAELLAVLTPWVGKEVSFGELQQAVNAIAEAYRQRGWFARPQLPAQDVSSGEISIAIIEGKLGAVRIDDQGKDLRIDRGFVDGTMTARQKPGDPLNLDHLDRSTNLLNDTPGVVAATILAAGEKQGESDAIVKVQDKPLLAGSLQLDTHGARSTGDLKLTLSLNLDNPTGLGDQVALNANASRGSEYVRVGYSLPVGTDGLRVGANVSAMRYRVLASYFDPQPDARSLGDAQTWGLTAYYPLLRSATRNVGLSLAYDHKDYYNESNRTATSEKNLETGVISLNGDALDGLGAGGMTLWSLTYTAGHVDLSENPGNDAADRNGPQTRGSYDKYSASLARLQRLTDKATLWASLSGQFAGKNLDSAEKMSLGGPSAVRAYPVIEGSGDDGWLATIEGRYNIFPELQVSLFYDHGVIRQSHDEDFTGAPIKNIGELKGYGLAVGWNQPGKFAVKATWAHRSGKNPFRNALTGKDSDGSLDRNRLWLTAVAYF